MKLLNSSSQPGKKNLKLIGALLEDMVQHVELCDSGHQAVERAKQMPFDLILMDIQMPDMDGIRACELIQLTLRVLQDA